MPPLTPSSPALEHDLLVNRDRLPWVVQKFGGTTVGKFSETIVEKVAKSHLENYRTILVCSARSGETKALGTTNRLLQAAKEALTSNSTGFVDIVNDILEDHLNAASNLISNAYILSDLETSLREECTRLEKFLGATRVINELTPRSKDIIIGTGEKLSCRIVTALLRDRGVDAEFVDLGNIVGQDFDSTKLDQEFYDDLASRIAERVKECGNRVPVVTGFFGQVPGSILCSIGRGYTDLCAALIAVGIGAEELQIWKEVDGIFTADPRKVPTARLLPVITPEEAAELTYYGSEVIHPFTMNQAIRASIPIRIKNIQNPDGDGTVIFPDVTSRNESPHGASMTKLFTENGYYSDMTRRHPIAVTIKNNIIVLNIHSHRKIMSHGFFASIFAALDKYGIVVDLISTSEVHVSMALVDVAAEQELGKALKELSALGKVDVIPKLAILSLVGKQMKNMVGIAGKMFNTLATAQVNIEMISQGASEINISCVIDECNADKALNAIHAELLSPVALGQ